MQPARAMQDLTAFRALEAHNPRFARAESAYFAFCTYFYVHASSTCGSTTGFTLMRNKLLSPVDATITMTLRVGTVKFLTQETPK